MYRLLAIAALLVLPGLGTAASAETPEAVQTIKLAAGPAYSSHTSGGTVSCRVFNNGDTSATIAQRKIFTNTNSAVTLSSDTCNVALAANKQCAYTAAVPGNFAFTCAIVVKSTAVAITGSMDIISSVANGQNLLISTPFLPGK